jgi:hypothetical protein
LSGQPIGLPGVEEVSKKDGDGRSRKNAGDDDLHGNAADWRDEGENEKKLEKIVYEKADKAVQVSTHEPAGFHRCRLR